MNARRVAELLRMRADLAAKMAEVDGELAAAFADAEPANDASAPKKTRAKRPTLVRAPALKAEPTDLQRAQAEAALRELGYR